MPNAVVSTDYGEPIQLKSLDGAFVRLRPLNYGMRLERLDKASKMYMEMSDDDVGRRRNKKQGNVEADTIKAFIDSQNKWARQFDFSYCIGEHNLEDANGNKLDFSNPMTLDILNPRVGQEISDMLDELNGEESDETLEDFFKRHTSSSQAEPETSSVSETDSQSPLAQE